MKSEKIEQDLQRRIEQSEQWVESPTPVKGLHVKGKAAHARPLNFLDSPHMPDRNGVEFELDIEGEEKTTSVLVQVRIKPAWTDGEESTSPPYVTVYVVHAGTGSEDLLWHDVIDNDQLYPKLAELPLDQWYGVWLNRALRAKANYKLFLPETQV